MATTDLATTSRDGFQESERTARDFICGDCNGRLTVIWRGDRYAAVCARWPEEHQHLKSHADVQADDIRARIEANPQLAQAMAISGAQIPLTTQAIKELDNEKLMARIPARYGTATEVTKEQRLQIAQLARIYGLDPLWDLMIYENRPYVTYEGRLRKLREHPGYRGHKVRPLSREEKEQWDFDPRDIVVECAVDMGMQGTVIDYGLVRRKEIDEANKFTPISKQPQLMAIKRAVGRASRQAVGIDLPTMDTLGGRVIVVEPRERAANTSVGLPPPADPEAQARRRFWATARGSVPDGLGLEENQIHELLGVESLNDYPGGWDQALSDLTEKAAARATDDDTTEADDEEERAPAPPAARPSRTELWAENKQLVERAHELGIGDVPTLDQRTKDDVLAQANADLAGRLRAFEAGSAPEQAVAF